MSAAADTGPAPAAPDGPAPAGPNHGLRIFLLWLPLALIADEIVRRVGNKASGVA